MPDIFSKIIKKPFLLIIVVFTLSSCATFQRFNMYGENIFSGKDAFQQKEYEKARAFFEQATGLSRDSVALALLAATYYKLNNIEKAEQLILEAERIEKSRYNSLRVAGYKALIMLKKNPDEGLVFLNSYVNLYNNCCDPLTTIRDVRRACEKKEVDIKKLEALIDEQILWYESDIEQFHSTGTGFYDRGIGGWSL